MKIFKFKSLRLILLCTILLNPLGSRVYKSGYQGFALADQIKTQGPIERSLRQTKNRSVQVEFRSGSGEGRSWKNKFVPSNRKGGRKLRELKGKRDLLELASSIQKRMNKKHLKIKRVLLGSNVKKAFKDKAIATHLSNLLSSSSLDRRLKALKRKLRRAKNKSKIKQIEDLKAKIKDSSQDLSRSLATGGSAGGGGGGGGAKKDEMGFQFMPGFNGMPFPPFMMNGPHFHPPLNVTVNALPNPNPRAQVHPSVLEVKDLTRDQEILDPILSKLEDIKGEMGSLGSDINVDLQGKLEFLLNRFT